MCTSIPFNIILVRNNITKVTFSGSRSDREATREVIWPTLVEVKLVVGDFKVNIMLYDTWPLVKALTCIMQEHLTAILTGKKTVK